jgi:ATP-dependent Lhr-like helicase
LSSFDRLHPGVQHHVVNSLGWSALRPLQEEGIEPILAGENALLLAPTAGGKTEAAVFPVLSRMLEENWGGLSVLYLCPLRALLNNLHIRLERFAGLVGRRVALWHADVGDGERRRILADPPDILLTTPESLEVMLVARRQHQHQLFGDVRVAIVDEMHAFAGDDRGWHLLSVLERVGRLAGRDIQRLGLSATIGNPQDLLEWLAGSSRSPRRVVAPEGWSASAASVEIDFVGSLDNAATVISRLHRGEKRLVFCDSRAAVEELAAGLHQRGVLTFVSHSSLGAEERRRAEDAFAAASDCVIAATSTLELGIDVGDLDHVIQIDAPSRVSAFLQRLGRTGRRAGTKRNCLFLATDDDTLLRACGLVELWREGYVEPVVPPPLPLHVFAQQLLGLTLQEGTLPRAEWTDWLGRVPGFRAIPPQDLEMVLEHMIAEGLLTDQDGVLSFGPTGERLFGGRNYPELFSVFASEPLFTVLLGRTELGRVHESTFLLSRGGDPVLLLAGRSWRVTHVDWTRREAFVEAAREGGKSRWVGSGQPLHFRLCRAVRRVLAGSAAENGWSRRARERVTALRTDFDWLDEAGTVLVRDGSRKTVWWTFAGQLANGALSQGLTGQGRGGASGGNLSITVVDEGRGLDDALGALGRSEATDFAVAVSDDAIRQVKFSECLPRDLAARSLSARLADAESVAAVLAEPIRHVSTGGGPSA